MLFRLSSSMEAIKVALPLHKLNELVVALVVRSQRRVLSGWRRAFHSHSTSSSGSPSPLLRSRPVVVRSSSPSPLKENQRNVLNMDRPFKDSHSLTLSIVPSRLPSCSPSHNNNHYLSTPPPPPTKQNHLLAENPYFNKSFVQTRGDLDERTFRPKGRPPMTTCGRGCGWLRIHIFMGISDEHQMRVAVLGGGGGGDCVASTTNCVSVCLFFLATRTGQQHRNEDKECHYCTATWGWLRIRGM